MLLLIADQSVLYMSVVG